MYELTIKSSGKKYQFKSIEDLTRAFRYSKIKAHWLTLGRWFEEKETPFDNGIVKIEKK